MIFMSTNLQHSEVSEYIKSIHNIFLSNFNKFLDILVFKNANFLTETQKMLCFLYKKNVTNTTFHVFLLQKLALKLNTIPIFLHVNYTNIFSYS